MALRDLLVYLDQSERAVVRLRLAVDLAARHGSRLTAIYVREVNQGQSQTIRSAELGLGSGDVMEKIRREICASIDATAGTLQSALEQLGRERNIEVEWRCVEGLASIVVPQHARYADLCILGQDGMVDSTSVNYTFAEQMLFVTGRPVLFIPASGAFETLGQRIVVAWNSSRAAARAVNDAMPLIERAEHTTVLLVNTAEVPLPPGSLPLEDMLAHLRRHDAIADAVRIDRVSAGAIANTLQEKARTLGADLIVAGAYGHPRLWEKMMGGVTRDLLAHMTLPILMSH